MLVMVFDSPGGKCTVALQVESGERLMKDFEPEATLWDVLTYWGHATRQV